MIGVSFGPFPDVGAPDWFMKLNKASIRVNKEFSMLLSPVIRKFVNTNQLSITNSEYIDSNNLQGQLNTSIGNMSTNSVYKDGERPLYIVDLHYDQTHPDIIYRLFNGKEIKFTKENQDFLMYLAQTLKISALKRSLANFIKFGESQTVKDLKEMGRLISEFNEETFDDVYNFLLKYLQSDDENAIRQSYFVAFVIFNGCVARPVQMELFVKLAEKLNILNEFTKVCIYNYKSKENLQESLFLIRHLLARAEQEESDQSNQKKDNYLSVANSVSDGKKSLVFSDLSLSQQQKKVDPKNNNGFSNDSSDNDEGEKEEEKVSMLQIFMENFTPLELSSFKLHKEYAEAGINNDPIAIAVRNDDVSIFTDESKVNRRVVNFSTYCVKPSLYERSTIINNSDENVDDNANGIFKRGIKYTGVPLICYAAYFGSIECFKYLVDEINVEIPSNLTRYAVCGGNSEILSFCHKRMRPREGDEKPENQSMTTLFNNYFGQPKEKQEENNDNQSHNEDENENENENEVQEEEENNGEQLSEESNVCVFDTRCLELAAIFHRFETFKFLDEVIQIPITDSVIDEAIKHFSFEVFVHILSKPGFDLNSLFLRCTKYSNEEAASLMSEFCDSYCLQEEDTLKTPLHYACEFGLSKIVKILIEKVKPSIKLKVNFDDEDDQSQANEEEEENAIVKTREAQLQFEEEEEEAHLNDEEEVDEVKARQVRFELDQNEQHEFDQEIQKGIIEQTSSEQVIHPIENEEEQQQESPDNNNQQNEEEEQQINAVEREINLEPEQTEQQQQEEEFAAEPEQQQQEEGEEFVPETQQQEEGEFVPETQQQEEGEFVPETQQQEEGEFVPETQQQEEGEFVPETQQQEEGEFVPETQQEEGEFVPETQQQEEGEFVPEAQQQEEGEFVPEAQQQEEGEGEFVPETQQQQEEEGEIEPEQAEEPQEENEQLAEEQIEHQQELIEQEQEQVNSEHENQPEQEEPTAPEETPEAQYEENDHHDFQERDIQLHLELEEEERNEEQEEGGQPQTHQDETPSNKIEIEEEEEEATEISIDDLQHNQNQNQQQQEQQQQETDPIYNEEESTEPNIEININERTEETNDNIESNDLVIPRNNEEEDVNPIDGSEIQEENILFKNNSLIEGNNELDELESPEVAERGVELNENENEPVFGQEQEIRGFHEEEEEIPPITFSPSTTSDEDDFINNISGFNTANASNINLTSPRNLNLSSNMMSRSVILAQNSVDLNAKDADNVTPLQLACKEGWLNIVRMFAQLDFDEIEYDAVSDYEKTALQFAEEASHHKIVDLLKKILENQPEGSLLNDEIVGDENFEIDDDGNNNNNDDEIVEQAEE